MKKLLGQYMTPQNVSELLANKVKGKYEMLIDLAAGDCTLLSAFAEKHKIVEILGADIDEQLLLEGNKKLPNANLLKVDGLALKPKYYKCRRLYVANPPFGKYQGENSESSYFDKVFNNTNTVLGRKRLEIQFLSYYLDQIKNETGTLVIIMPISFCDGERYRPHRKEIMENYDLEACIEFPAGTFIETEARTAALIISSKTSKKINTLISMYDQENNTEERVYFGKIKPGERLDAKYFRLFKWDKYMKLCDLGVSIYRGKHSKKAAKDLNLHPIHTTDLSLSKGKLLSISSYKENDEYMKNKKDIFAEPGDILLSRTGKRVSWKPLLVSEGKAPITDHVFRIRAPKQKINMIIQSFENPNFNIWLDSVCKGVCASVLTKYDLMRMPIFSKV